MLNPPMNQLLAKINNRYLLVNVAAQRARQIAQESDDQGIYLDDKPVSLALMEIADNELVIKCAPNTPQH